MADFDLAADMERLADAGYAPMILNDDNGNWCVADEGFGTLRTDDNQDFTFQVFGKAEWFKPTVIEAWNAYLERMREYGNEI